MKKLILLASICANISLLASEKVTASIDDENPCYATKQVTKAISLVNPPAKEITFKFKNATIIVETDDKGFNEALSASGREKMIKKVSQESEKQKYSIYSCGSTWRVDKKGKVIALSQAYNGFPSRPSFGLSFLSIFYQDQNIEICYQRDGVSGDWTDDHSKLLHKEQRDKILLDVLNYIKSTGHKLTANDENEELKPWCFIKDKFPQWYLFKNGTVAKDACCRACWQNIDIGKQGQ